MKIKIATFEKLNMPKIILTGACGFVGSNIAKRLLDSGYKFFNVDNLKFGNLKNVQAGIEIYEKGFEFLTEETLSKFDILIHCATSNIIYAMDNPIETFQNNATNTLRLFQKFKGKIIYTSTASVYGQADIIPTPEDAEIKTNNAYDQSKYISELFLQERGNYTTLRLSNVYGINQRPDNPFCGVMGKLINNVLNNEPVKINGDGLQTRDYSFIDDIVDVIIIAIEKESLNTEINIATGKETSINELISIIEKVTEKNSEKDYVASRKIDGITRRCLSVVKAKELLNWEPKIFLEDGIKKTINWMQSTS